ncbi:MAG: heavy metal translocating P-type ATPase [Bacteroidetes bacterium]|nr:MAG: heavy metal translocating P-type ATPase [Bacteroidota bacterium]
MSSRSSTKYISSPAPEAEQVAAGICDLCGLRLPSHPHAVIWKAASLRFCCSGCRQVFLLLAESGLLEGDYKQSELYQTSLRLGIIAKPDEAREEQAPVQCDVQGAQELVLRLDGMWCSSCSWLIEKVVSSQPGVVQAKVMYAADTAKIFYKPELTAPATICAKINSLGYSTSPRNSESDETSTERKSLLIKTGVALFLMNNIMFFSYVLYIGYFQELASEMKALIPYILFGLTLPSVFWCGLPIHKKAFNSVAAKAPTMELLFSMGIFAAFFFSVYAIVAGHAHYYFDTAASLVALLLLGKYVELAVRQKASENVHRLYSLLPKKVRIKAPEGERLVSVEKLQIGDLFIVKSGEKIPADGTIVHGRAIVDESLLTGESKPVEKNEDDTVIASSLLINGHIEVETTRTGKGTVLSNIIQMVEQALSTKSPLEQTVDKVSRVFIPGIIGVAIITFTALSFSGVGIESALLRAITILVIACPCALGMATPLAIAAGIGYAAKRGILIRDGEALQRASGITTVVFDKTGTLTEGKFALHACVGTDFDTNEALYYLGSLEQFSSHPVANSIVAECKNRSIRLTAASDIRITDGMGIAGYVGNKEVCIGIESHVSQYGHSIQQEFREIVEREVDSGRTVVFFGIEGCSVVGFCTLGDSLKPGAGNAIHSLEKLGISSQVLSGDTEGTTKAIANLAGIQHYHAQALPKDKIEYMKELQSRHERIAMVGDGVNDAPALAQADLGIAISEGTELAISSASVTLLRDDLLLVPETIDISRRTVRIVKQNLGWAFLYNSIGILLAVAGVLNPLIAAGAMLASSLSVVVNSIRLREHQGKIVKKALEILFPWREP